MNREIQSKTIKTPRKIFSDVGVLAHSRRLAFESKKQVEKDVLVDES